MKQEVDGITAKYVHERYKTNRKAEVCGISYIQRENAKHSLLA